MNLLQWLRKRIFRGGQDDRPVREPEHDDRPEKDNKADERE